MAIRRGKHTFLAETAVLLGDVDLSDGVAVFDHTVLRGDMNYIKVGRNSNLQDNVTVHTDKDNPAIIGENVSVGHNAVVHGCTIKDNVIIGIGSIILNGAVIGSGSVVGAGAVVTEGFHVPENSLLVGIPASIKKQDISYREYAVRNGESYQKLRDRYLRNEVMRETGKEVK